MIFNKLTFVLAFSAVLSAGCGDDDTNLKTDDDFSALIENVTNEVILLTYQDLDSKTALLVNTLTILENAPSAVNLDAARQAWRDSRIPWEQSEGFLYGPVDLNGIDPSIDSWPVNEADLDNVLNSSNGLSKEYIDGLDGTLKGFHTIEYLLFGTESGKLVSDFTPRQFEYLRACGQSLKGATGQLYQGWLPSGGNFVKNFLEAGTTGSIYPSQKSVLEEMVNGLVAIADEVANGKIYEPYVQQDVTLEESRFSANSKADFADNIRSIKNIYLGIYANASGTGISGLILEKSAALDAKVRQQIEDAISAIGAIQGTFTTAIFNSPESVQNAQVKVRTLQETLQAEVLAIVSNL